jgi:hypothetical protein
MIKANGTVLPFSSAQSRPSHDQGEAGENQSDEHQRSKHDT